RLDDLFARHFIAEGMAVSLDHDFVARLKFKDVTEECVAVRRDHGIAVLAGRGSVFQMSRTLQKLLAGSAFRDHGVKLDLRNLQAREQRASRSARRGLLSLPLDLHLLLAEVHPPVLTPCIKEQPGSGRDQDPGEHAPHEGPGQGPPAARRGKRSRFATGGHRGLDAVSRGRIRVKRTHGSQAWARLCPPNRRYSAFRFGSMAEILSAGLQKYC